MHIILGLYLAKDHWRCPFWTMPTKHGREDTWWSMWRIFCSRSLATMFSASEVMVLISNHDSKLRGRKKKKNHILIWVKKICSQDKISIVNSLCMCLLTSSGHQTHRGGGSWAETTVRTGYSAGGFLSAAVCCQTSASLVLAPAGSSSF